MSKSNRPPTREQVNSLIGLYRSKQYSRAIDGAREFIRSWPDAGLGWNLLAASLEAIGELEQAAEAYKKSTLLEPQNHDALNNYGNLLRELGRLDDSERVFQQALQLKPDIALLHYNLGVTLIKKNERDRAEKHFRKTLQFDPQFAYAHNYLGNIYSYRNQLDAAAESYSRAVQFLPGHSDLHNNLGSAQLGLGNLIEAEQSFRKALQLEPDSVDALGNLGVLYLRKNQPEQAETCFKKAVSLYPDQIQNRNNLALAYHHQGKLADAQEELEKALQRDPEASNLLHNLGNLALDINRLEQACEYHRRVTEIQPESATAFRNLGVTLAVSGQAGQAEEAYRHAISLDPGDAETYYRLSEVHQFASGDEIHQELDRQLAKQPPPKEAAFLHYAAGKAWADIGNEDARSFENYAQGAVARRSIIDYDIAQEESLFESIAAKFNESMVERISQHGYHTEAPIFVVGMPRSGTTLVEHILSSHTGVYGAGERFDVQRLVTRTDASSGMIFPAWVSDLTQSELEQMGEQYWHGLVQYAPDADRVVDKMPNNFQYAGLIYGILNGAQVVHVKRSALDTCYSCFTHLFEDSQNYSYELSELGRFYRAYWKLMQHWKAVLPADFFCEVQYEDIVQQPEQTIGTLLEQCGLSWEPACLNFHQTQRVVPTASLAQVRQPLYKTAIGRWQPYEEQLQPLIAALGDLAEKPVVAH